MQSNLKPRLVPKPDAEIEFSSWPRIEPGEYKAYARKAVMYQHRQFKRWLCLVLFDVLDDHQNKLATVAWYLNLGRGEKPKAAGASKFLAAWIKANGGRRPTRADRISLRIFRQRMATVVIEDTRRSSWADSIPEASAYSVVRDVKSWDVGSTIQPFNHSTKPQSNSLRKEPVTEKAWQKKRASEPEREAQSESARRAFLEKQKQEILAQFSKNKPADESAGNLVLGGTGCNPTQPTPNGAEAGTSLLKATIAQEYHNSRDLIQDA